MDHEEHSFGFDIFSCVTNTPTHFLRSPVSRFKSTGLHMPQRFAVFVLADLGVCTSSVYAAFPCAGGLSRSMRTHIVYNPRSVPRGTLINKMNPRTNATPSAHF